MTNSRNARDGVITAILCIVALLLIGGLLIGGCSGVKAWQRGQKRADANNQVRVTAINIRTAQQQAKIVHARNAAVQAQAEQRLIEAKGIRHAQDEISRTLTPLYVQHEAIRAQERIATSGKNNTVIYVPAGTNGTPVITQDGNANSVGQLGRK
jgi:Na+-transporting NADH:ubiquinone oxidoreductase subunit NqrC